MRPNSRMLAMRDTALAAALGIIGTPGADFGAEDDEGFPNADFGVEFGAEFGNDYGFGADAALAPAAAPGLAARGGAMIATPEMIKAWQATQAQSQHTQRREMLLEPNKGSRVKIERYQFSMNQDLTLGTSDAIDMSNNPDTTIRPQRLSINAPACGFAVINGVKVANVSVQVGGSADAFEFNANGVGQSLDMPTLSPANRASVTGEYTGYVPTGYVLGTTYKLCATFKGPSQIVA